MIQRCLRTPSTRAVAVVALVAIGAVGSPGAARADEVLVYGSRAMVDVFLGATPFHAQTRLLAAGHTVTVLSNFDPVPANLADYDVVVIATITMWSAEEATLFVNYVRDSGKLYLTGERPGDLFTAGNLSTQTSIVRPLVLGGGNIVVGTGAEASGGDLGTEDDLDDFGAVADFGTMPDVLDHWTLVDAGVIGGLEAGDVLLRDELGAAVAAAWLPARLQGGRGCMMLVMDSNWWGADNYSMSGSFETWATTAEIDAAVSHVMHFFAHCADGLPPPMDAGMATDAGIAGDAAAMMDAGPAPDASAPTAPDSGTAPDAATAPDSSPAAIGDGAAARSDAGTDATVRAATVDDGGCGCTAPGANDSTSSTWLLATLASVAARGLRRRCRGR